MNIEPNVVLFHREDTQIKYFPFITKRRERFLENEIIGNLRENFSLEFWGKLSKYKNQNTMRSLE